MKRPFRKRGLNWLQTTVYVFALTLITLNFYIAKISLDELYTNHHTSIQLQELTRQRQLLLSAFQDLETGYRGFLLSGKPEYLEPYNSASRVLPDLMRQLKTSGTLRENLVSESHQMRQSMLKGIAYRKANPDLQNTSQLRQLLAYNKQKMDNIRDIFKVMQTGQKQEIQRISKEISREWNQSSSTSYTTLLVNLFLLTSMFYLIWRNDLRKQEASEAILASESRKRSIFETAYDGMLTLDKHYQVTEWNPACERIFGCSSAQMSQANIEQFTLMPVENIPEALTELHFKRYDGQVFPAKVALRPIEGLSEKYFILYIEDISDQKAYENTIQQARQDAELANASKSLFLANMSHELRTPLNVILGYTELLQEENVPREKMRNHLNTIQTSGQHLFSMINDLLDLSKIEAGKMNMSAEKFEVAPLVRDIYQTVLPLAKKNQNRLKVNCAPDLGTLYCDRTKLYQCLLNLLSNAAKFTESGTLMLEAYRESNEVVFVVQDTGIGMSTEQQAKLFKPFMQADITTTKKYGGTGLGLALTQKLVELLEGSLSVESALDQGSRFTLRVPTQS